MENKEIFPIESAEAPRNGETRVLRALSRNAERVSGILSPLRELPTGYRLLRSPLLPGTVFAYDVHGGLVGKFGFVAGSPEGWGIGMDGRLWTAFSAEGGAQEVFEMPEGAEFGTFVPGGFVTKDLASYAVAFGENPAAA